MTDIRIRDVDSNIVQALKVQARRNGKTLQAELKDMLTEAALRSRRELAVRLTNQLAEFRKEFGTLPDSTYGIRAERDGME